MQVMQHQLCMFSFNELVKSGSCAKEMHQHILFRNLKMWVVFLIDKQDRPLRTTCTCIYNLPWPYWSNQGELKSVDRCFTCASYEIRCWKCRTNSCIKCTFSVFLKIATGTEKLQSIQN